MAKKQQTAAEPLVRVNVPLAPESDNGEKVDQNEYVVVNGEVTQVRRGEYVDVKVPVFLQLKQKYPGI